MQTNIEFIKNRLLVPVLVGKEACFLLPGLRQNDIGGDGMKERDTRIELLRTLACFLIILTHIRLKPISEGEILKTTVLLGCFMAASVDIFFLLAGAFLYEGERDVWQTVKRFLLRILAPALLLVILTLIFERWILGAATLSECLKQCDLISILKAAKNGVICLNSDYWGLLCGHLWYIAEYGKLMLMFPFIVVLARFGSRKVLLYLTGFNLLLYLLIDLYQAFPLSWVFYNEPFVSPAQTLALFGFLLYRDRKKLEGWKMAPVVLLCAYLIGIVWMFWLQVRYFTAVGGDWSGAYYVTWLSGISMFTALLLMGFFLSLPRSWKLWAWLKRPVNFLGRRSYAIYLIQYAVITKLDTLGVKVRFAGLAANSVGTVLYYVMFGLLVFGISLGIAAALHAGWGGLRALYSAACKPKRM